MKRILLIVALFVTFGWVNSASAQVLNVDCDEVVSAHFGYQPNWYDNLNQDKYDYLCYRSKVAFAFVEEVPAGAVVLDVTSLVDYKTQMDVNRNIVFDETNLNLYRYDFRDKQAQVGYGVDIYFKLHAGDHEYLKLYSGRHIADLSAEYLRWQVKDTTPVQPHSAE